MHDVEQGRHADHLGLVVLGLDGNGLARAVTRQDAVGQHAVFVGPHAGHQRRVVRPGDRRVDDAHPRGRDSFAGQSTDVGNRRLRIIQQVGGKAVDTDDNNVCAALSSAGLSAAANKAADKGRRATVQEHSGICMRVNLHGGTYRRQGTKRSLMRSSASFCPRFAARWKRRRTVRRQRAVVLAAILHLSARGLLRSDPSQQNARSHARADRQHRCCRQTRSERPTAVC